MATLDVLSWIPGLLFGFFQGTFSLDSSSTFRSRFSPWVLGVYVGFYLLSTFWLSLVTRHVPEPYLDEVFHIPQAQLYCNGEYGYWDPKLTTPPGLYIFAVAYSKVRLATCSVPDLRILNPLVLSLILLQCVEYRHMITTAPQSTRSKSKRFNQDTIHTALNVALFPPLFFFAGLLYTDVLSTYAVLETYNMFLRRKESNSIFSLGSWKIYLIGVLALLMRQTNIFWVAVFLGGLEAVRCLKQNAPSNPKEEIAAWTWKEKATTDIKQYTQGSIHDIPLSEAAIHDFILTLLSLTIAILFHPLLILLHLWPYIALLLTFLTFVIWNGGVVLGDKSNHVATLHIPQLFYLQAFTAFFSFPLLIPPILNFIRSTIALLKLPLFPRLCWKYALCAVHITVTGVSMIAVVRWNTIIHPFTLADNRHYMFYIFRYSILRHWAVRYLLVPVYMGCGYGVYLTLCSDGSAPTSASISTPAPPSASESTQPSQQRQRQRNDSIVKERKAIKETEGPTTSFLLILLLTTTLSLITAPLVEPRYFIVPWVIWRLHVPFSPSLTSSILSSTSPPSKYKSNQNTEIGKKRKRDSRLWAETLWFLLINALTGYVFLYRGFQWAQEEGRVQRFMW